MNRYPELLALMQSLEKDFDRFFEKHNNAAGTRVRKGMQDIKTVAQEIRASVQDVRKAEIKETVKRKAIKKGISKRRG